MDENFTATNENVRNLLRVFVAELIKLPLKLNSISEAIFAATRPRNLIPIQPGVAIATDNEFS